MCAIVLSFLIACNMSPKSKIVVEKEKVLITEWGGIDSLGSMYLTLLDSYYKNHIHSNNPKWS